MIDPGYCPTLPHKAKEYLINACPKHTPESEDKKLIVSHMWGEIKYIDINDIASLLSISKRTLERVIKHDERFPKPCITVGKKAKWKESRIIDFLDTNIGIHLKTS